MRFYSIAEQVFCLSDNIVLPQNWELFRCDDDGQEPLFTVVSAEHTPYVHQIQHHELPFDCRHTMRCGNSFMLAQSDWTRCMLLQNGSIEDCNSLLHQIFYTHLVQKGFLQIHSSLVDYQGSGILFLGPSGIGKTTQAELWHQYRDAAIINGDSVMVEKRDDRFIAWGTPWHGSSSYCLNQQVPLKALVVLKQGPENVLVKLQGFEKITGVSGNIFYPLWLENGAILCTDFLNDLLSTLPVYQLTCRPDEDAVMTLWRELKQESYI